MNSKMKNIPISLIATIVVLLLLIVLISSAQNTLGRYMSSFGGNLGFSFTPKQSYDISYGAWETDSGRQTLSLNISGSGVDVNSTESNAVKIRLFIPNTENLSSVMINFNNAEYIADISAVPEGTSVHRTYGAGNVCCFYGADGKEISFDLSSSTVATLVLISEAGIDTSGIGIMVEPMSSEKTGGN